MRRLLLLLPLALCAASCVTDDWDDYDDDYDYRYERPRRHRYDYDDYDYYDDRRPRRPPPRDDRYDRDRRDRYRDRDRDRERDRDRGDRGSVSVKTPKGFVLAGSFRADGAVECGIPTSKKIKKVRIVGTAGSVSVNTVVLREGSAKSSFPVSRRLGPGETAEIDLGGARQATGLRISTGGNGSYNVYVH